MIGSALFKNLIERATLPTMLIALPSGRLLAANQAARQQLDIPADEGRQTTLAELFKLPPGSPLLAVLSGKSSADQASDTVSRVLGNDCQVTVSLALESLDHQGEPYALVSCLGTPAVDTPDSLRDAGIFLSIFDNCPVPLVYATPEGVNLRINRAFAEISGYTPEEVVGHSALDLHLWHHPEEREIAQSLLKEHGRIDNLEATLRKKDGTTMICLLSTQLILEGGQRRIISTVRDISSLKTAQQALQASEALFREFFYANPVATIITSPSGTIHMVNPAFTSAAGFSEADVVGRTAQEMGFWQNAHDRERMVSAVREHGYIDNLEACFYGKGNRPMTCLVSSRAVEYQGELRILNIVHDITEQRKAEETLRRLDQAKNDFISTAAHELRTPLVAVVGYAELLENAAQFGFSEEQKQSYASIIHSNAAILNRLVADLQDVERIQLCQPLSIVKEEIAFTELIENAVASFKLTCPEHQFTLNHENPLPETLRIDGSRITQALHNLLDNAVKYTPGGGNITISTAAHDGQVMISIRDQGVGMTAEQVAQIFDKFYRANPTNALASGLGLGMSIVKQIVEDHDGEISVTSRPGEGTTIALTLPVKTSAA